jgi:hypothetical protein
MSTAPNTPSTRPSLSCIHQEGILVIELQNPALLTSCFYQNCFLAPVSWPANQDLCLNACAVLVCLEFMAPQRPFNKAGVMQGSRYGPRSEIMRDSTAQASLLAGCLPIRSIPRPLPPHFSHTSVSLHRSRATPLCT